MLDRRLYIYRTSTTYGASEKWNDDQETTRGPNNTMDMIPVNSTKKGGHKKQVLPALHKVRPFFFISERDVHAMFTRADPPGTVST